MASTKLKLLRVWVSFARPSHSRPAMAGGIYSANLWKCAVGGLDSRFRGNDRGFRGNDRRIERIAIPNDTSTKDCTCACIHVDAFVISADPTL